MLVFSIYMKHAAILLAVGFFFQLAAAQDRPKRPRITGIDHVRLYVTDIGKANDFYSKIVGLPTKTAYGCRTVSLPCFVVNTRQQIELQSVPWLKPKNWLAEIAYATDNIEQMRGCLLAPNVDVTPITKDLNDALHFELRDPEGNALSFIHRAELNPDFTTTNNRVSKTLIHAGFVVRDIAAENHFYVDVLGFRLYWYGGMKDDGVDWYELQVPDGDNWIEDKLKGPPTADHKQPGGQKHFSVRGKENQ